MIIQINATVCAAVDHGEGRQLKIAGRDQRKMMQERPGKGQLPGGTTNPRARQKCRFLQPMQYGEAGGHRGASSRRAW